MAVSILNHLKVKNQLQTRKNITKYQEIIRFMMKEGIQDNINDSVNKVASYQLSDNDY